MRLDLPSGTAVRFEPGDTKEVKLIPYGGGRVVYGFNDLVDGRLDDPYTREQSIKRCIEQGTATSRPTTGRRRSNAPPIPTEPPEAQTHERQTRAQGLRQEVRPDEGRPYPAGRHRADHRDRGALRRLRRGVDLRRRQVDPRRARPVLRR